jgi:hypothetical protein
MTAGITIPFFSPRDTTSSRWGRLAQMGALGVAFGSVMILSSNGCNHLPSLPADVTPLPFLAADAN